MTVAITVISIAIFVPICNACERAFESVDFPPFTKKEPIIEATMPAKAIAIGNTSNEIVTDCVAFSAAKPVAKATKDIGAIIEPA